ncbi:MAG: PfkB family carbohydrate kinase [Chloroflexota bacterium]|jgi:sulfofructose kinase
MTAGHDLDVLCVGVAAYDLIFTVDTHLVEDVKMDASALTRCGGGPAANAAATICRLGHSAAFAGYLGRDPFGDENLRELAEAGVRTDLVRRGDWSTPLSAVMVKPNGSRSLVNYRDPAGHLPLGSLDLAQIQPGIILFDGHEPVISSSLAMTARQRGIPIILDAGSARQGAVELASQCDHLVCALKFALDYTGAGNAEQALEALAGLAPTVVITLGDRGLIWRKGQTGGRQAAFAVDAVDTTGAGDVFHGAYAVSLVEGMAWEAALRFASAAAALCCGRVGARLGIPSRAEVESFLAADPATRG